MIRRKFLSNTKLYTAAARDFWESEDERNPASRDPNWKVVVAGPPQGTDEYSAEALAAEGYVGLYAREPGEPIDVPADDDPRRRHPHWMQLLSAACPSALNEGGGRRSGVFRSLPPLHRASRRRACRRPRLTTAKILQQTLEIRRACRRATES